MIKYYSRGYKIIVGSDIDILTDALGRKISIGDEIIFKDMEKMYFESYINGPRANPFYNEIIKTGNDLSVMSVTSLLSG